MMEIFSLILALIKNFTSWMHSLIARPALVCYQDSSTQTVVMTIASPPRKRALRTYKDLADMSSESELGKIIAVTVGYESRGFQVHLSKLGPLSKLLEDQSDKSSTSISLPNERPETFNAVINWIYNEPLPRAGKPSEYIDDTNSLVPIPQSTQEPYLTWISDVPIKEQPEQPQSHDTQLEDAYHTQCMLLDVMMLAERHDWEQLYNAAIDAFREGEANLQRERPSLQHIEVVYKRTSAESPIRKFMGDYAYSLAIANKDIMWYWRENWFRKFPEFLEDMLKRVDGNGPFQYPFQRHDSQDSDGSDSNETIANEAPLDLSATTYHFHGKRMELDCRRSSEGSCAVE
ncbi:hypothetical protein F4678DRAFT_485205 [Xylaria arbuscula]|nr:hypothetical protein F4678DRAFT_485205 [Xylaria arbuscula]